MGERNRLHCVTSVRTVSSSVIRISELSHYSSVLNCTDCAGCAEKPKTTATSRWSMWPNQLVIVCRFRFGLAARSVRLSKSSAGRHVRIVAPKGRFVHTVTVKVAHLSWSRTPRPPMKPASDSVWARWQDQRNNASGRMRDVRRGKEPESNWHAPSDANDVLFRTDEPKLSRIVAILGERRHTLMRRTSAIVELLDSLQKSADILLAIGGICRPCHGLLQLGAGSFGISRLVDR